MRIGARRGAGADVGARRARARGRRGGHDGALRLPAISRWRRTRSKPPKPGIAAALLAATETRDGGSVEAEILPEIATAGASFRSRNPRGTGSRRAAPRLQHRREREHVRDPAFFHHRGRTVRPRSPPAPRAGLLFRGAVVVKSRFATWPACAAMALIRGIARGRSRPRRHGRGLAGACAVARIRAAPACAGARPLGGRGCQRFPWLRTTTRRATTRRCGRGPRGLRPCQDRTSAAGPARRRTAAGSTASISTRAMRPADCIAKRRVRIARERRLLCRLARRPVASRCGRRPLGCIARRRAEAVECRSDRGRHGSVSGDWYAGDGTGDPWTRDSAREIPWDRSPWADPYILFAGNYLNYLHAGLPVVERSHGGCDDAPSGTGACGDGRARRCARACRR